MWILRTVVPGGTRSVKLLQADWTLALARGCHPTGRRTDGANDVSPKPLCRAGYLFLIHPFTQQPACFYFLYFMPSNAINWCISRSAQANSPCALIQHKLQYIHSSSHTCQKSVLSCISLLYVRHRRINIWLRPLELELDGSGALWCQYRDQFGRGLPLYTPLSWPEIPRPTLVNTPTDFKTNCGGADKHVCRSRLYGEWHEGHYHVNAPIDSSSSWALQ